MPSDDVDDLDRFRARYACDDPVLTAMERAVIGDDYGANGYTTAEQVERLGRLLALTPRDRVLDIGTGKGWPGLRLAHDHGCAVVASDVPVAGLRAGLGRVRGDGRLRAWFAAARAEALPFRPASFDAVVHTDVLC